MAILFLAVFLYYRLHRGTYNRFISFVVAGNGSSSSHYHDTQVDDTICGPSYGIYVEVGGHSVF